MPPVRLRYQSIEFGDDTDIHVRTLRDKQQYSDVNGEAEKLGISSATWPIFGVIWPSGYILANLMFDFNIEKKRILEVGCGIGLASLVLNHRNADITATDYHPEAEKFLDINAELNQDKNIPFVRAEWAGTNNLLGKFDLIIGSDLLYEREHFEALSYFINQHADSCCQVILVDPGRGRGYVSRFNKKMLSYQFSCTKRAIKNMPNLKDTFKGDILQFDRCWKNKCWGI